MPKPSTTMTQYIAGSDSGAASAPNAAALTSMLTSVSGASLWAGVTGTTADMPLELLKMPEPERFNAVGSAALDLIAANPLAYLIECATKLVRALSFQDFAVLQLMLLREPIANADIRMLMPAVQLSYLLLLAASLRSLWVGRAHPWMPFVIVAIGAALAQILIFQVWLEFRERHRLYVLLLLLLLLALGLERRAAGRK